MAAGRATRLLKALAPVLAMLALCQVAAAQDQESQPSAAPTASAPDVAASGRSTGLPVPRFVSLGADQVNLRYGPGREYPVSWVLARRGLPVEIIAEFDAWRKVRLHDNDEGWIHSSLLSSRRTIVIKDEIAELRRTPTAEARVVLRAEPGVIGELLDCEGDWCRVDIEGHRGWLRHQAFWGALLRETVPRRLKRPQGSERRRRTITSTRSISEPSGGVGRRPISMSWSGMSVSAPMLSSKK